MNIFFGFGKFKGIFKFRTTPTGTLPRDEDLYRTIVEGVPGTYMPAWKDALTGSPWQPRSSPAPMRRMAMHQTAAQSRTLAWPDERLLIGRFLRQARPRCLHRLHRLRRAAILASEIASVDRTSRLGARTGCVTAADRLQKCVAVVHNILRQRVSIHGASIP